MFRPPLVRPPVAEPPTTEPNPTEDVAPRRIHGDGEEHPGFHLLHPLRRVVGTSGSDSGSNRIRRPNRIGPARGPGSGSRLADVRVDVEMSASIRAERREGRSRTSSGRRNGGSPRGRRNMRARGAASGAGSSASSSGGAGSSASSSRSTSLPAGRLFLGSHLALVQRRLERPGAFFSRRQLAFGAKRLELKLREHHAFLQRRRLRLEVPPPPPPRRSPQPPRQPPPRFAPRRPYRVRAGRSGRARRVARLHLATNARTHGG